MGGFVGFGIAGYLAIAWQVLVDSQVPGSGPAEAPESSDVGCHGTVEKLLTRLVSCRISIALLDERGASR